MGARSTLKVEINSLDSPIHFLVTRAKTRPGQHRRCRVRKGEGRTQRKRELPTARRRRRATTTRRHLTRNNLSTPPTPPLRLSRHQQVACRPRPQPGPSHETQARFPQWHRPCSIRPPVHIRGWDPMPHTIRFWDQFSATCTTQALRSPWWAACRGCPTTTTTRG